MSNTKFIGGILLIAGTSIGGGMLALPISTAALGFTNSLVFLFLCWLVMTCGALLMLEVSLRLPVGNNIISMAKVTLGPYGQIIAWVSYLGLLYTLLAGYIAGGSDVLNSLFKTIIDLPSWCTTLMFTLIFSLVVYCGIKALDYFNRGFMLCKFAIYFLLVATISPKINLATLQGGSMPAITGSLMILITSFGFASIVPTLREYYQDDIPSLRKVILIGSMIPLTCYIIWNAIIMGVIHRDGSDGLITLMSAERANSGLITALSHAVHSQWINIFFSFFASICMITAFLGVSIGLFDFLADGLSLQKNGIQKKITLALTFLPPITVVIIKPDLYLQALNYAGICCVVLLLLLPALMSWRARKINLGGKDQLCLIPGGNSALSLIIIIALILLIVAAK